MVLQRIPCIVGLNAGMPLGLCDIITSCITIISLISRYNHFACYRNNCHRNNNVLKVRPKRKIQVHVVLPMQLASCNEAVNKKAPTQGKRTMLFSGFMTVRKWCPNRFIYPHNHSGTVAITSFHLSLSYNKKECFVHCAFHKMYRLNPASSCVIGYYLSGQFISPKGRRPKGDMN